MDKKKRFRPTVTAYRALEDELAETKQRLSNHLAANIRYVEDIHKFTRQIDTLTHSNKLLVEELRRVRKTNAELLESNIKVNNELQAIKSRGFWKRLFNLK